LTLRGDRAIEVQIPAFALALHLIALLKSLLKLQLLLTQRVFNPPSRSRCHSGPEKVAKIRKPKKLSGLIYSARPSGA
jgi:hypothetical protein